MVGDRLGTLPIPLACMSDGGRSSGIDFPNDLPNARATTASPTSSCASTKPMQQCVTPLRMAERARNMEMSMRELPPLRSVTGKTIRTHENQEGMSFRTHLPADMVSMGRK